MVDKPPLIDEDICEVCGEVECTEDCECENCMLERGERYMEGMRDTYD